MTWPRIFKPWQSYVPTQFDMELEKEKMFVEIELYGQTQIRGYGRSIWETEPNLKIMLPGLKAQIKARLAHKDPMPKTNRQQAKGER